MKEVYIVIDGLTHIGINVINELKNQNKEVKTLVSKKKFLDKIPKDVEVFIGDVTKEDSLKDIFKLDKKNIYYVINCSDYYKQECKDNKKLNNILINGTENILNMCIKHHVDKYIHVASYEGVNPTTEYGKCISNMIDNILVKSDKLNISICLTSSVIGPKDYDGSLINNYFYNYYLGNIKKFVSGSINLVDVRDVASAVINASLYGSNKKVYNLVNIDYDIKELFTSFSKICNKEKIKKYYDVETLLKKENFYKKYCDFKKIKPMYNSNSFSSINVSRKLDNKEAVRELDFSPRSILETLNDTKLFFDLLTKK